MPRKPKYSDEQKQSWLARIDAGETIASVARDLGVPTSTVSQAKIDRGYAQAQEGESGRCGIDISYPDLPDDERNPEELWAAQEEQFNRHLDARVARAMIHVEVNDTLPIAVSFLGDPHINDGGTNTRLLREHLDLIKRTPGMSGVNIGDTTNNWIGNLAKRLEGKSEVRDTEQWKLAEDFVTSYDWLIWIAGNHDCWSDHRDILANIARHARLPYEKHGANIALNFPSGRQLRINARHNFKGHSEHNSTHGAMKAAMRSGFSSHLYVNGHTHVGGYHQDPQPGAPYREGEHVVAHCLNLNSYKWIDEYQQERGLEERYLSPCMTAVINPYAPDNKPERFVKVFMDPEEAADWLLYIRKRVQGDAA